MSATTLSETDAAAHDEGSWWQRVLRALSRRNGPPRSVVASIVTIANLHFHWLRAFDTLHVPRARAVDLHRFWRVCGKQHRTVVVEIDATRRSRRIRRRKTPLDRAQLKNYLAAIYAAEVDPDIVVMDLDISPAMQPLTQWLANAGTCAKDTVFPQEALRQRKSSSSTG